MNSYIIKIEDNPVEYLDALFFMEKYVGEITNLQKPNLLWLLEHTDVYTKGTDSNDNEITSNPLNIPIINTNRGGKWTYHGVGQRILYPIINLQKNKDIKNYVNNLQILILIQSLV